MLTLWTLAVTLCTPRFDINSRGACIAFVFCVDLRTNRNFSPIHH